MDKSRINRIITCSIAVLIFFSVLFGRYSFISDSISKLKLDLNYLIENFITEVRCFFHQGEYEYLTDEEIQELIEEKGGFDKEEIMEYEMQKTDYIKVSKIKTVELYTNKSGKLNYAELVSEDEEGNQRLMITYDYIDAGYKYYNLYINGNFEEKVILENPQ